MAMLLVSAGSLGQAPTVSYAGPQTYTVGSAIAPLTPTSTGVAAPGYTIPAATGSGLNQPFGVAIDGFGNVYVADAGNNAIKKIPAGGGTPVSLGSGFNSPRGIAFKAGNLYIADYGNNAVKKMPIAGGTPTTLATGLNSPEGISLDVAGNVYVTCMGDNSVKEILVADGTVVTVATGFNAPAALTIDAYGNVYVADSGNNQVQMIPAAGGSKVVIGRGFTSPMGVAVDASGNVYVADSGNNHVKKIYASGGTPVVVGSNFTPYGIIVDNTGNIYAVDHGNALVKEIKPIGGYYIHPALPAGLLMSNSTGTISGTPTTGIAATTFTVTAYNSTASTTATVSITVKGPVTVSYSSPQVYTVGVAISPLTPTGNSAATQAYSNSPTALGSGFSQPYGVAVDAVGNVYVADCGNNAVKKIPAGGGAPVTIGSGFVFPTGVAVDRAGNVYVADRNNNAIKKIPIAGGAPVTIGSGFAFPTGVAVDPGGNVFVADAGNNAIKEIPISGGAIITMGAGFSGPTGVSVDAADNVYVADKGNNAVKKIPAGNGAVITLGSGFINPFGVSADNNGNVFVADQGNNAVKEIPGSGGATFVIGSGFGTSYSPYGVTTDGVGNVYVADFGDNAIEKVKPVGGYYVSPALPAGLVLNNSTGTISGTPGNLFPATNFNITAYNATSSALAVLNIQVNALKISYGGPQTYAVGTAITPLTPATFGVAAPAFSNPVTLPDSFYRVDAIAVDETGNVYEAELAGKAVRKILPSGSIITLASNLPHGVTGIAVDPTGNVFYTAGKVMEIPAGTTTPVVFSTIVNPYGIATDAAGNVFVTSYGDIYKIPASGGTPIKITVANFSIAEIAINGDGKVYASSTERSVQGGVYQIPLNGDGYYYLIGDNFSESASFGVAMDGAGNTYVASPIDNKVWELPVSGTGGFPIATGFNLPNGIAISHNGNIYVANQNGNNVSEFKPVGGYFIWPTLPTGLKFDQATGTISGTPTVLSQATSYTIVAYNSFGSNSTNITIGVIPPPLPSINYVGPKTFVAGTAIAPYAPTTHGVAAYGYSRFPITIASGFNNPNSLAIDNAGNIYVADMGNNAIKEILAGSNNITTVGSGFSHPSGIFIAKTGDIYIADSGNHLVKKIPFGSNTTVNVGSGWSDPEDVALDASGNIYVADKGVGKIEELPVGSNTPSPISPSIYEPTNVLIDNAGNIYFNDDSPDNRWLRKIPPGRGVLQYPQAGVKLSRQMIMDCIGNLYIADSGDSGILILKAGAPSATVFSISADQIFKCPTGIAIDPSGNIYIADDTTNTVKVVKPVGGYYISPALPMGMEFDASTGTISGTPTTSSQATTYTITAYNFAGGTKATVVIGVNNPVLPTLTYPTPESYLAGTPVSLAPAKTGVSAFGYTQIASTLATGFYGNSAVAVDASGNAFVAGYNNNLVEKIPVGGGALITVATGFNHPSGIAVNASGDIYVADYGNNVVKKIPAGSGSAIAIGSGFLQPWGVAVDAAGNVYVGDSGNDAVKKIPIDGGAPVTLGSGFTRPTGVAVDLAGNVYVADAGNNAVKEIPANGSAVLTLGSGFFGPTGVSVDASGNVYVSDESNNALKMIPALGGNPVTIGGGYVLPVSVAVDHANVVYTTDASSGQVQKLNPSGGFYVSPMLPQGLAIDGSTGNIAGTPVVAIPATNYTVTAYNIGDGAKAVVNIKVTSNPTVAGLADLILNAGTLSPLFSSSTTAYTSIVSNTTATIIITPTAIDPAAIVKVNGAIVSSGSPSASIPVHEGSNTITIVVTAANGVNTKTYTLTVIGKGSDDAALSALTSNYVTLIPYFYPTNYNYEEYVASNVASIQIIPTTDNVNATVMVNGAAVISGSASEEIPLIVGFNNIVIVVTAQNGVNTQIYTLSVRRLASPNAHLSNLKTNAGVLTPAFSNTTTSYTKAVANSVTSITVTPTAADPAASIQVNGTAIASGAASSPITLPVGNTTINIYVVAPNGTSTITYTIVVTRVGPGMNNFYQPVSVEKPLNEPQPADDGILVHQGLSPNGDGINDFLLIDGIANYPDNKLQVMNRSGQLVFEAKNYDNSTKVFDGHSNKTGAMQLPGTYFYSLDYTVNGVAKHKTGFIVLKY